MSFILVKYEAWNKTQASTSTANLVSTSGTRVFVASRSSWVIDSGGSAHMIETPSILSSLTPTTVYPSVYIADGCSCFVKWCGLTKPTHSLTLNNGLYVLGFPINLLAINTITIHLIVLPFFTLSIVSSWTFVLVRGLVWGIRIVVGSMSSCWTPLPLGFLSCFLALLLLVFCGIVDLVILVFLNLGKPYHGYLYLSLCTSCVK